MGRLRCSYQELLATPVRVIDDVMLVMETEAKAAVEQRKDAERTHGR